MTLWNQARAASKRPLPRPIEMHAPVRGLSMQDGLPEEAYNRGGDMACRFCGYHLCACQAKLAKQIRVYSDQRPLNEPPARVQMPAIEGGASRGGKMQAHRDVVAEAAAKYFPSPRRPSEFWLAVQHHSQMPKDAQSAGRLRYDAETLK